MAVAAASVVGFLLGLLTLRNLRYWHRWCPICGVTNVCPIGHDAVPDGETSPRHG